MFGVTRKRETNKEKDRETDGQIDRRMTDRQREQSISQI